MLKYKYLKASDKPTVFMNSSFSFDFPKKNIRLDYKKVSRNNNDVYDYETIEYDTDRDIKPDILYTELDNDTTYISKFNLPKGMLIDITARANIYGKNTISDYFENLISASKYHNLGDKIFLNNDDRNLLNRLKNKYNLESAKAEYYKKLKDEILNAHVVPGSSKDIYIDGEYVGRLTSDNYDEWLLAVNLLNDQAIDNADDILNEYEKTYISINVKYYNNNYVLLKNASQEDQNTFFMNTSYDDRINAFNCIINTVDKDRQLEYYKSLPVNTQDALREAWTFASVTRPIKDFTSTDNKNYFEDLLVFISENNIDKLSISNDKKTEYFQMQSDYNSAMSDATYYKKILDELSKNEFKIKTGNSVDIYVDGKKIGNVGASNPMYGGKSDYDIWYELIGDLYNKSISKANSILDNYGKAYVVDKNESDLHFVDFCKKDYKYLLTATNEELDIFFTTASHEDRIEAYNYIINTVDKNKHLEYFNNLPINTQDALREAWIAKSLQYPSEKEESGSEKDYFNINLDPLWQINNIPCSENDKQILKLYINLYNNTTSKKEYYNDIMQQVEHSEVYVKTGESMEIIVDGKKIGSIGASNPMKEGRRDYDIWYEQAIDLYNNELALQGEYRKAYLSLAKSYYKQDYEKVMETEAEEFKKFVTDNPITLELIKENFTPFDWVESPEDVLDMVNYMSTDELYVYLYLNQTVREEDAKKYLDLFYESRNYKRALINFETFKYDLENIESSDEVMEWLYLHGYVDKKALEDGLDTWLDNQSRHVRGLNIDMTQNDYEKIFIIQYLAENHPELLGEYNFFVCIGQYIPAALVSVAATVASCGNTFVGNFMWNFMCSINSMNGDYRANLQKGYSSSVAYTAALGSSFTELNSQLLIQTIIRVIFKDRLGPVLDVFTNITSAILSKELSIYVKANMDSALTGEKICETDLADEMWGEFLSILFITTFMYSAGLVIKTKDMDEPITFTNDDILEVVLRLDQNSFDNNNDYAKYFYITLLKMGNEVRKDFSLEDIESVQMTLDSTNE